MVDVLVDVVPFEGVVGVVTGELGNTGVVTLGPKIIVGGLFTGGTKTPLTVLALTCAS